MKVRRLYLTYVWKWSFIWRANYLPRNLRNWENSEVVVRNYFNKIKICFKNAQIIFGYIIKLLIHFILILLMKMKIWIICKSYKKVQDVFIINNSLMFKRITIYTNGRYFYGEIQVVIITGAFWQNQPHFALYISGKLVSDLQTFQSIKLTSEIFLKIITILRMMGFQLVVYEPLNLYHWATNTHIWWYDNK